MPYTVRYLTHPQVTIDPLVEVPQWSLSDIGKARVDALVQARALQGTTRIISSQERKAIETAEPLADMLCLPLEISPVLHENDRSATGFLPGPEFEAMADAFFAQPDISVQGWEPAAKAQKRVCDEIQAILSDHQQGDVLFVGHGGVGTLLWCHLSGQPISRTYDQGPGDGGNWFAWEGPNSAPKSGWTAMETLAR